MCELNVKNAVKKHTNKKNNNNSNNNARGCVVSAMENLPSDIS